MPSRRIAIMLTANVTFLRRIYEGIIAYARERPEWLVSVQDTMGFEPVRRNTRYDGIIALVHSRAQAEELRRMAPAIVNITSRRGRCGLPSIWPDHGSIGTAAAEHLMARGLVHFAFCGDRTKLYSRLRQGAFLARLAAAGRTATVCDDVLIPEMSVERWDAAQRHLQAWLRTLNKPCGVLAVDDGRAAELIVAAKKLGISVPGELAVIGVNDDDLICYLTDPPLSSVRLGGYRMGQEAACLLDRLMDGQPPPDQPIYVQGPGLAQRGSTDVLAVQDPAIHAVLTLIRREAPRRNLTVEELLVPSGLSRRSLDRRFREAVGRSAKSEIVRVRLEHLCQCLGETDWRIAKIAERMGFCSPAELSRFFTTHAGQTASDYRHQWQRELRDD